MTLVRLRGEDLPGHAQPAPTDEVIIDRPVRTIFLRRAAPALAVSDHEDDP
jgi:hypothetical protein